MAVPILSGGNLSPKGTVTCPMSHSKQTPKLMVKPSLPCYSASLTTPDRETERKLPVLCLKKHTHAKFIWSSLGKMKTHGFGGTCIHSTGFRVKSLGPSL